MGHFVPLAEGVDAGAAGFVEAGGVEDPPGDVGVGGVALALTSGPSALTPRPLSQGERSGSGRPLSQGERGCCRHLRPISQRERGGWDR
jgi:hypothetical protein